MKEALPSNFSPRTSVNEEGDEEEEEEDEVKLWRMTSWGNEDVDSQGKQTKSQPEERSRRIAAKKEKLKDLRNRSVSAITGRIRMILVVSSSDSLSIDFVE